MSFNTFFKYHADDKDKFYSPKATPGAKSDLALEDEIGHTEHERHEVVDFCAKTEMMMGLKSPTCFLWLLDLGIRVALL